MENRDERLPADADANKAKDDIQQQNQEEFDDRSKEQLDRKARNEQSVGNQSEEDSQSKHEEMIPPEKNKDTDQWDKVNRQFPNLKK